MNYSDKLKHPKWQKKRLLIFDRDGWQCKYCNDKENTLNVHHLKYTAKEPHNEPDENLVTVCENCHSMIEFAKKNYKNIGEFLSVHKTQDGTFVLFFVECIFIFDGVSKICTFCCHIGFINRIKKEHDLLIGKKI